MTVILGVDTETTGQAYDLAGKSEEEQAKIKAENPSEIVELGLSLFHVEKRVVLAQYSTLFSVRRWGDEAAIIHGVDRSLSEMMPLEAPFDPWDIIRGEMADYVVAHNAEHDHPLVTGRWQSFLRKPWLCTQKDLKHMEARDHGRVLIHRQVTSLRLGHLCVDYGIPLMGWHRALADAEACARVAAYHNLDEALKYKNADKFKLYAKGKFIDNIKEQLQEAPSCKGGGRRYFWDGEKKAWIKEDLTDDEVLADSEFIKKVTKNKWDFDLEKMPAKTY